MGIENNPVIGRDPWTSECTFTATSEESNYPATNLNTSDLGEVWRSTSAAEADTSISWTVPRDLPVGLVAPVWHNGSQSGTFRLRIWGDVAKTDLKIDTTIASIPGGNRFFPQVYTDDQLASEDDNWMTGQYRTDELVNKRFTRPIWLGRQYLHRAGQLDISNPTNEADYFQIGRLIVARGHQFSRGITVGSRRGHDSNAIITQADGGKEYGLKRIKPRTFQGSFTGLPRDEAQEVLGEMKDSLDRVDGFIWHCFPNDPRTWLRESFYARFQEIDLGQFVNAKRDQHPVNLREFL